MLSKEQIAKLLNRSLTSSEVANFDTYLKIAVQRLEQMLCMNLCGDGGERTYETREGYRTLYVDPFTDVTTVTVDGVEITAYTKKQNDRFNGSWYNVIEFDSKQTGKNVTVDADWGFRGLPADLQLLLAKLFAQGSVEQTSDSQVKSKKIEDFSVTYKDSTTFDEFVLANTTTIDRYSQCNVGAIRHGYVQPLYYC